MLFPSTGGELLGPGCSHVLDMSMPDHTEELVASLVAQMVKNLPAMQETRFSNNVLIIRYSYKAIGSNSIIVYCRSI